MQNKILLSNNVALHELTKDGVSICAGLDIAIDLVKWLDTSKALVVLSAIRGKDIEYLKNLSNGITLQVCGHEYMPLDDPGLPPLMRFNNCQVKQWFFAKPTTIYFSNKPVKLSVVLTCELELFTNGNGTLDHDG